MHHAALQYLYPRVSILLRSNASFEAIFVEVINIKFKEMFAKLAPWLFCEIPLIQMGISNLFANFSDTNKSEEAPSQG